MIFGKLLGLIFGLLLFGPIGGIVGLIVGHQFDKGLLNSFNRKYNPFQFSSQHLGQQTFFNVTFAVMGHLAKADGRISEDDIKAARKIMQDLGLNEKQKQHAIQQFNLGKQPDFNLQQSLQQLLQHCHQNRIILTTFVELQWRALRQMSPVTETQQAIMQTIMRTLGFRSSFYQQTGGQQRQQQYQNYYNSEKKDSLAEAYALLEISSSATKEEIKKAYRKQMSRHHPDKLMSKGLPPEMMKLATEKTQKIQAAYDLLRDAKGIK